MISTAAKIAEVLHSDQSMAGNVLKVANSPLYRARSEISSLQDAVARLGMQLREGQVHVALVLLVLDLAGDLQGVFGAAGAGERDSEHPAHVGMHLGPQVGSHVVARSASSFVTQCFDWVQLGGLPRREDSEEQPHTDGNEER